MRFVPLKLSNLVRESRILLDLQSLNVSGKGDLNIGLYSKLHASLHIATSLILKVRNFLNMGDN